MTVWEMWAGRPSQNRDGLFLTVEQHKRSAEMYGVEDPIRVAAFEDPEGPYYGWIEFPSEWRPLADGTPRMIQPHDGLYNMQFPYGPEAEEEKGRGRTVRLRVEVIHADSE
jgi:hypothetical protein